MPCKEYVQHDGLQQIVREVNDSTVAKEDWLSDLAIRYNCSSVTPNLFIRVLVTRILLLLSFLLEVNDSTVAKEDWLSDQVYMYSRQSKEVSLVCQ